MDHAVVVHDKGGGSNQAWYPWIEAQLAGRGFEVTLPDLPYPDEPHLSEWLPELAEAIGHRNPERKLVIAHGLGCMTLLHYLANLAPGNSIGGAVLVAGATCSIDPAVATFYRDQPHFDWLQNRLDRPAELIYAANDPCAPLFQGEQLAEALDGRLTILSDADSLLKPELPAVLHAVERLLS
jgi:predicted alpha/beta hydrolase family esterase